MSKKYQLRRLSSSFYDQYNRNDYPEIMQKQKRPYIVLLIKIDNLTFALPFRTNIPHEYCYRFKNTNRTTKKGTGIDFTKAIIINDEAFLGEATNIDSLEFLELENNLHIIVHSFKVFLKNYRKYILHKPQRQCLVFKYSSLQYFHNELNLPESQSTKS